VATNEQHSARTEYRWWSADLKKLGTLDGFLFALQPQAWSRDRLKCWPGQEMAPDKTVALPVGPSRFEERRLYTKKPQRMQTFLSRPQGGHSM
jgi:hypothetical protein